MGTVMYSGGTLNQNALPVGSHVTLKKGRMLAYPKMSTGVRIIWYGNIFVKDYFTDRIVVSKWVFSAGIQIDHGNMPVGIGEYVP